MSQTHLHSQVVDITQDLENVYGNLDPVTTEILVTEVSTKDVEYFIKFVNTVFIHSN